MKLSGKRVAILVEAEYQDMEVHYPRYRLIEEGAETLLVGTGTATKYFGKWGYPATVDIDAEAADPDAFDGLIIPGGWAPDKMRICRPMVELVRSISSNNGAIGCICHGGWLMASAGIIKGKRLTSYEAIRDDMVNAGAEWIDSEVVVDGRLVTSRMPSDLPAFMREFIRLLAS